MKRSIPVMELFSLWDAVRVSESNPLNHLDMLLRSRPNN